jgi:3D (Asp-Asp-Asp) domain-containing protein
MAAVLKKRSKYLSSCLSLMAVVAVSYPSSDQIISAFADDDKKSTQAISTPAASEKEEASRVTFEDRISIPTKPSIEAERDDEVEFQTFQATAYCLKGRTASGQYVRPGIIAADPRVLPLGTVVHIRAGRYTGTYTVADTGGLIKGRRVDIYFPTYKEAMQFGRQKISLRIISPASGDKAAAPIAQ